MIQVGRRKSQAQAEFIPLNQEIEILESYANKYPIAFKGLAILFLGKHLKPGRDGAKYLAEKMPMVAFHPNKIV